MTTKTRRGVYLNLENSIYVYRDLDSNHLYKFSSAKKLEMFKKQLALNYEKADKCANKLKCLIGYKPKFNKSVIMKQTYLNMRYN